MKVNSKVFPSEDTVDKNPSEGIILTTKVKSSQYFSSFIKLLREYFDPELLSLFRH